METFSALLALCVGNSRVTGEVPAQRPVTRSFDVLLLSNENWANFWKVITEGYSPKKLAPIGEHLPPPTATTTKNEPTFRETG